MKAPLSFGKYLLVDRINAGGMAEVFLAKAFGVEGFERVLAIKRILPNLAEDGEFIDMFVDEARIAVRLSHENIVQIHELGKLDGQYYIAMEYVSGKDLRQILEGYRKRQKALPVPAAAYVAAKVCEGLDYAHRKTDPTGRRLNVIHRDVSPQNVLVGFEGAVKLTDFGIAKAEDRASKTQAGVLKGKFSYMSPEQVRGLEIDHRSDVFAVGILLYEMVTGRRLFVGESDFSTLEKVRKAEIVPLRQVVPEVPEALERVIGRALARERDERYAWASDLHDDLQQFLIDESTIYNAKRLAALLEREFADDIERERQRMQQLMLVRAPLRDDGAAGVPSDPALDAHGAAGAHPEKTVIFESAALAAEISAAPTTVSPEAARAPVARADAAHAVSRRAPAVPERKPAKARETARSPRRQLGLVIVGASVAISAAALLAVASFPRGGALGTGSRPPAVEVELPPAGGGPAPEAGPSVPPAPVAGRLGARLVVRSKPAGAAVFSGPNRLGVTPFETAGLDASREYALKLVKEGYREYETTVALGGRAEVVVDAELERERRAPSPRQPASGCGGSGAKLSVMAKGVADCRVTVGETELGVSPFVNRDAPAGRCVILVSCPDGKRYRDTRVLAAGVAEKLIIEPDMWQ